jgi:TAP-like protein
VILDSVLPPQVNHFTKIPQAAVRAFDVLFHGCTIESHCNTAYPNLQAVFYQLVADLNTTPITFQTTPQTGQPVTVHFTGNDLVQWLRDALYSTSLIPMLPAVIFQIRQHDYTQLAQTYSNSNNDSMNWGLFYSVMCGEDAAFTTQQALEASVQGLPPQVQPALLDVGLSEFSVCQFWKVKSVPAVQKEPVRSAIPTLILQGEYDPATQPADGMLAAQTLSKSYFFLFPGVGHGVEASNASSCPHDITWAFLDHPTEKPDASCIRSLNGPSFT